MTGGDANDVSCVCIFFISRMQTMFPVYVFFNK